MFLKKKNEIRNKNWNTDFHGCVFLSQQNEFLALLMKKHSPFRILLSFFQQPYVITLFKSSLKCVCTRQFFQVSSFQTTNKTSSKYNLQNECSHDNVIISSTIFLCWFHPRYDKRTACYIIKIVFRILKHFQSQYQVPFGKQFGFCCINRSTFDGYFEVLIIKLHRLGWEVFFITSNIFIIFVLRFHIKKILHGFLRFWGMFLFTNISF